MKKPNYGFERHKREMAKKKKREEKDARKREKKSVDGVDPMLVTPEEVEELKNMMK